MNGSDSRAIGEVIYSASVPYYHVVGMLGNFLSLVTLRQPALRQSTTCFYMMCLAILDGLVLFSNFTIWLLVQVRVITFTCVVYHVMDYFMHLAVFVLVVMAAERYFAIRYPLHANVWFSIKRSKKIVSVIGMVTLLIHSPSFVLLIMKGFRTDIPLCLLVDVYLFYFQKVWVWIYIMLYAFLPLLFLVAINALIIKELRRTMKGVMGAAIPGVSVNTSKQRQITIMLLATTSTFFVLTAPMAIGWILEKVGVFSGITNLYMAVSYIFAFCNHCFNFVIYYVSCGRFRETFKKYIRTACKCNRVRVTDNLSLSVI